MSVCQRCEYAGPGRVPVDAWCQDRKSTRLNSSHSQISYAVFCLKKKKKKHTKLTCKILTSIQQHDVLNHLKFDLNSHVTQSTLPMFITVVILRHTSWIARVDAI